MRRLGIAVAAALVLAGGCGGDDSGSEDVTPTSAPSPADATTTTEADEPVLRILVTNDDGVGALGIDALVDALRALPATEVTVVAPLENASGSGGRTTDGLLTAEESSTASGYSATAVTGFPADTIIWAIDGGNVSPRPHLVMSGINEGQNLGSVIVDLSGTVGAARAAAQRGIPAVALSQGLAAEPDYASGVEAALAWLAEHRAELLARGTETTEPAQVVNINIPTCPEGEPRDAVEVPLAGPEVDQSVPVDCVTPYANPTSDIDAFVNGYIARTTGIPLDPAA
jgi:5'-nucleotidase